MAAFVLMILSTVSIGWCLIPLAWLIPFDVMIWRSYKYGNEISTGAKVCMLLFGNMIAGILLLCDSD